MSVSSVGYRAGLSALRPAIIHCFASGGGVSSACTGVSAALEDNASVVLATSSMMLLLTTSNMGSRSKGPDRQEP
jgi:hypothetical protein